MAMRGLHAYPTGRVTLWVQIDQQSALPSLGQSDRQIDRCSRLSDATFLIRYAKNSSHSRDCVEMALPREYQNPTLGRLPYPDVTGRDLG